MPAQGRVGDDAKIPADSHGAPCCPHTCVGPGTNGSPNVEVNNQKALRVTDPGKHSACCGKNAWNADQGSSTVTINNLPSHRVGDRTKHCGGVGSLIVGSPNVVVGGAPTGSASGPGTASAGHPVDVVSGAMFTDPSRDFALPGVFALGWTRGYRSSNASRDCGLGYGWTHEHYWTAERVGEHAILTGPDGQTTDIALPVEGKAEALPLGRTVLRRGDDLFVDTSDGLVRVLRRSPEGMHRLTEIVDRSGNVARFGWAGHEIVRLMDTAGRRAFLVRDGLRRTWLAHARGVDAPRTLAVYEHDERGDLVRATDARKRTTEYTYDAEHAMLSERRADGLVFHFRYARVGEEKRCIETWGELPDRDVLRELGAPTALRPVGPLPSSLAVGIGSTPSAAEVPRNLPPKGIFHTSLKYTSRLSTVVDGVGATHRYEGTTLGVVTKYTDPAGVVRTYTYDAQGQQTSFTDGLGNRTTVAFDDAGRPISETDAAGAETAVHDLRSRRVVETPGGGRWQTRFDARGRIAEVTDPAGGSLRYELDGRGQRTSVTRPDGVVESSAYDADGNLIRRSNADGSAWTFEYDPFGVLTALTDPRGHKTTLAYDEGYNLVAKETGGARTEYQLDAWKRIVATKYAGGAVIRRRYVADSLVETTLPDGGVWRMGYDAVLRPAWIVNPAGERYEWQSDPRGKPKQETTFAGVRQSCEYDAEEHLSRVVRPDGIAAALAYDKAGRLLRCDYSSGAYERYDRDAAGRILVAELSTRGTTTTVEYTRDALGDVVREVQTAGDFSFTVDYERDAASRVASRRYSSGWGVDVQRSGAGLATRVRVGSASDAEVLELAYDERGSEIARRRASLPGQSVVTKRNDRGLPERITVLHQERPVRERSYTWSPDGAVLAIADAEHGTRAYELDGRGRVVSAEGLGASERLAYSKHGTPISSNGPSAAQLGPGGRPLNTRTSTLAWDELGRLAAQRDADPQKSWTYAYDEKHQLAVAVRGDGVRVEYVYDALGRRLLETCGDVTTRFCWDRDSLVEEQASGTPPTRRVFADDGYTPLLESTDGAGYRLVATDAAGTPWAYVDRDGGLADLDLTPTGKIARAVGKPGLLRFAGQREDARTGLSYNRHRYYSPELGVFLSPDPLELRGSAQDIAFVPNATCVVDPLGLFVAIIQGPDTPGESIIASGAAADAAANPGSQIFNLNQLTPGSLSGADSVIVDAHGVPGYELLNPYNDAAVHAGNLSGSGLVDGKTLGQDLNKAGFQGGPNHPVKLDSCNSGTKPLTSKAAGPNAQWGSSTAQQVANVTGSPVTGAVANDPTGANLGAGFAGGISSPFAKGADLSSGLVSGDGARITTGTWQTFGPAH